MANDNNLPRNLLVIDDDVSVGLALKNQLSKYDINVFNAQTLEKAIDFFNAEPIDVALISIDFSELHGSVIVQKFRASQNLEQRATGYIMTSGKGIQAVDDNFAKELMDVDLVFKPFNMVKILSHLSNSYLAKQRLRRIEKFEEEIRQKLREENDPYGAIDIVKSKINELGVRGIRFICELYEKAEKYSEGVEFIKPFVEKDQLCNVYLQAYGHLLRLDGKYEQALIPLQKAYNNTPHNLQRLEDLIRIYLALEQPDDAVEIMDMLIQFNPETVDIKFDMFKMLIETGFIEKAKTFCKRLTKPVEGLRYYNNKGVELSQKGNIRGAIHEYERAILLFPDFKEIYRIHYNIALARIKLNTLDELRKALKSLEISIKLEPTFEKAKFTLVTVNNLIKNMEAAEPQGPAML